MQALMTLSKSHLAPSYHLSGFKADIPAVLLKTQPFADSKLPLAPRLLPTIFASLPLLITLLLARHVRTRRTAAQIISDRSTSAPSGSTGRPPKFELDILRSDAIKPIKIFEHQEDLFVELSRKKGMEGLRRLMPQIGYRIREKRMEAWGEKGIQRGDERQSKKVGEREAERERQMRRLRERRGAKERKDSERGGEGEGRGRNERGRGYRRRR
jgi:hypothetical protein